MRVFIMSVYMRPCTCPHKNALSSIVLHLAELLDIKGEKESTKLLQRTL